MYTQPLGSVIQQLGTTYLFFFFFFFAVDSLLHDSAAPSQFSSLVRNRTSSIEEMGIWMKGNKLKVNDDKTEFIAIGSKSKLKQVRTNSMVFQDCEIEFSESVWNLGVFLDESLSVEMQVNQLCKVLYFQLCRISKIHSFLTVDATNTLAVAFILSCLDYCNSLLAGLPDHKLAKLQRIQNSAARLILRKPWRESATPFLKILHWLPVKAKIEYKVSTLCYQCFNSVTMPSYLCELLQIYKPIRTLRSQDSSLLVLHFSLKTYGKR